jgi:putative flippase GtrA
MVEMPNCSRCRESGECRPLRLFNVVSLVGLAINTGMLLLLMNVFNIHYLLSNLATFSVAMLRNYLVNLGWTWR